LNVFVLPLAAFVILCDLSHKNARITVTIHKSANILTVLIKIQVSKYHKSETRTIEYARKAFYYRSYSIGQRYCYRIDQFRVKYAFLILIQSECQLFLMLTETKRRS